MADRNERLSKRLAYVLRHHPGSVGVELSPDGWVGLDGLVAALSAHGRAVTVDDVAEVIATASKPRFEVEGGRIRAAQGHSLPVDLGLAPVVPPDVLFHGTVARFLPAIRREGLRPGSRTHVHLSPDRATAVEVGQRRGAPIVLVVRSAEMAGAGHELFRATNGVWLTAHVPPAFLDAEPAPGDAAGE